MTQVAETTRQMRADLKTLTGSSIKTTVYQENTFSPVWRFETGDFGFLGRGFHGKTRKRTLSRVVSVKLSEIRAPKGLQETFFKETRGFRLENPHPFVLKIGYNQRHA